MCGRFETTGKFSWAQIHAALSTYAPVRKGPRYELDVTKFGVPDSV
jgi:hypothetical protein